MKKRPQVIVVVEGGIVTEIYSSRRNLKFIVLDHDNAADVLYDPDDEIVDRAVYDPKMKFLAQFRAKYAKVICCACLEPCLKRTAHRHQKDWIGDECCWDEWLRSSE